MQDSITKGSVKWLKNMEIKFGGYLNNVKRNKVSVYDPRTDDQIKTGGMIGGDRMSGKGGHDYSYYYSKYLKPFINQNKPITLCEIGILLGTGLAIWSDLFGNGRIIGLDIDLTHIKNNMTNLKARGAFTNNNIEFYEFDQYKDNKKFLFNILKCDRLDIVIDDGVHYSEAILATLDSMIQYLSKDFLYIIEDNASVHEVIKKKYPHLKVENYDLLTVITPKSNKRNGSSQKKNEGLLSKIYWKWKFYFAKHNISSFKKKKQNFRAHS